MTFLATMSDTLTANGPELIILLMLVYIIIDNRWTKKSIQAIKEDIVKLDVRMNEGFREMRQKNAAFRAEIKEENAAFRAEIRVEIKDIRAEIKDVRTELKDVRKDIEKLNAKTDRLNGSLETILYFSKPHIKPNTGSAREQKADVA